MNEIEEFIDDLYLMIDSMSNGRTSRTDKRMAVPTYVSREHYNRLVILGLPQQRSRVTIWRAIKYLENYNGSNNNLSTIISD